MVRYETPDRPDHDAIPLHIDGDHLSFVAPKLGALVPVLREGATENEQVGRVLGWLEDGLGAAGADRHYFTDRLSDPTDRFDVADLMRLFRAIVAEVSGRPTTPPSDSGQSSSSGGTTSEDGPQLEASTFPA